MLLPPILGEGPGGLGCILDDEFDELVSWIARGRECTVQVNDESDGESRCLHPHMNESDIDDFF